MQIQHTYPLEGGVLAGLKMEFVAAHCWHDAAMAALQVRPWLTRDEQHLRQPDMHTDRIDFISAYCDRWCERCAFTERCSLFAVEAAMAMCDGDDEEAMELAVGRAPSEDAEPQEADVSAWIAELNAHSSLTPAEAAASRT